jgi:hypothetical protein
MGKALPTEIDICNRLLKHLGIERLFVFSRYPSFVVLSLKDTLSNASLQSMLRFCVCDLLKIGNFHSPSRDTALTRIQFRSLKPAITQIDCVSYKLKE